MLKLHKVADLTKFIMCCNAAIDKNRFRSRSDPDLISRHIKDNDLRSIWRYYSGNASLWEDGYACWLNPEVRETFDHYRCVSAKKQQKMLTKDIRL